MTYADGILFVAENPSSALHKISEIYDRLAFAAVGKYNEFENLRVAGVRMADLRGYSYDRRDVTGRALANTYSQILGTIFSSGGEKPFEVEITVAEVGETAAEDQLYRLTYDGSVNEEHGVVVMGGSADAIDAKVGETYRVDIPLGEGLRLAVSSLAAVDSEPRTVTANQLEVAVLERSRPRRTFRRLSHAQLEPLLAGD
jgi:proteasome alpha subunit